FGDVDQNGTGSTGSGDVKGTAHGFGQILDVAHQEIVLDAGPGNADRVAFLEGIFADGIAGHLTADDHHGNGVHIGGGNACDGIGQARAAGDQRNTDLVGRARIGVGRMYGSLLVANQNMLEIILFVDCVVNVQYRAARVAKDMVYALFGKATHDDVGAIEFHIYIPFVTSTCTPIGPWAQA